MSVDTHTHIWRHPGQLTDEFVAEANRMRSTPINMDVTPEQYLAAMAAVDRAIVVAFDAPHSGIRVPNDYVAALVRRAPEKLIGYLSVDPHAPDALEEMERQADLGLRGLKTSPIYQNYHPHATEALRMFKRAEELRLPVLIHQGATFPRRAPLKYAHPEQLEDIALLCPDLHMVIAHLGHPWETETIVLIRKHPHLYADISGLFYRPWQLYNSLRLALEYGVWGKLIFGTDYPVAAYQETVDGLREIPRLAARASLPPIPEALIEQLIERDPLPLLGLE
jgi:predicted TIM-barrel fold metal-dependent hydrolase